jgi:hypothetical protein
VRSVHGSYSLDAFDERNSERLIIVCERRTVVE